MSFPHVGCQDGTEGPVRPVTCNTIRITLARCLVQSILKENISMTKYFYTGQPTICEPSSFIKPLTILYNQPNQHLQQPLVVSSEVGKRSFCATHLQLVCILIIVLVITPPPLTGGGIKR